MSENAQAELPDITSGSVLLAAQQELLPETEHPPDGIWLQDVIESVACHIRDWNLDGCWLWQDWPDRERVMPAGTPPTDLGIDLVGRRRDDGRWVAIQAKSRQLDDTGAGDPVKAAELDSFLSAAAHPHIWAERWVAVNGAVGMSGWSPAKIAMSGAPVKVVNVAQAVDGQLQAHAARGDETCGHCKPGDPPADGKRQIQTRTCMQNEAANAAVARLREHELVDTMGIPKGEARGRIVLPCGTGKTRIALRIVEQLTVDGELSVVLCPSIALVAQIRREFLEHTERRLRVMAVCSDKGVAADEEKVARKDDPTQDRGMAGTEVLKGCPVTTDPAEISDWISTRRKTGASDTLSVIFGTYQSAHRIAEAIRRADAADGFRVLICDEAHRTASVQRKRRSPVADEWLRNFTLCHDSDAFPATYRVYQTATPRIYGDSDRLGTRAGTDYVIRDMDDQETFGVELYRRQYVDAVENGWLSDYRIIAMGVGGSEAMRIANQLVAEADARAEQDAAQASARCTGRRGTRNVRTAAALRRNLPTTGDYMKGMGFALAMGGAAVGKDGQQVPIRSCIGFLNTIDRSKAMTQVLQSRIVQEWVAEQVNGNAAFYQLEHLDASSSVAKRDEAKRRLASAGVDNPHAVLNVGIFGEGTDSPSLSAVAFLEPRKSPIDVVQAVGRAMRRSEGKQFGYIVVPVVIPRGENAERHLAISDRHEGWQELGAILQALRAHDARIEEQLSDMLTITFPPDPPADLAVKTVVAVGRPGRTRLDYGVHTGHRDEAEETGRQAVEQDVAVASLPDMEPFHQDLIDRDDEPTRLVTVTGNETGETRASEDNVARYKPRDSQTRGIVNVRATKKRAVQNAAGKQGRPLPSPEERAEQRAAAAKARTERDQRRQAELEGHIQGQMDLIAGEHGLAITMNLLAKSGLTGNKVKRDLNILADAVGEASRHIHAEHGLAATLDTYFGNDRLAPPKKGKPRADGATIAALLWMNAAMLQQRVHAGGWLRVKRITALADVKSSPNPERLFTRSWNAIARQDFVPVIDPALEALDTAVDSGRLGGLRRALCHLAEQAEQIAETYADMGTDHAGALFNQVMGDQSSDGAYFTRPPAADMCARLAFQAVDPDNEFDWSDPDVWRDHKTVDLACGSGTLLTAAMTEMKRRAKLVGADHRQLAELQKVAVEEVLKGLDINDVSLQLAATQLMSGNTDVKYREMGLHKMPYGPQSDGTVAAGTPELFGHQTILHAGRMFDDTARSQRLQTSRGSHEMDDAAADVADARIVIMNPPFTNRQKMGEKFPKPIQVALRRRMDTLEGYLADADPRLSEFLDKNSLGPRFAALADLCLERSDGVFATVIPTIALTNPSGLLERLELARRFHIHTVLTHLGVKDVNFSQGTHREMNESIVVLRRHHNDDPPPTRIISLDRFPHDKSDIDRLFHSLDTLQGQAGGLAEGWGAASFWPVERIQAGDWSAAVWRSPELAAATIRYGQHSTLGPLSDAGLSGHATGQQLRGSYRPSTAGAVGAFPILKSKSGDVHQSIEAHPDEHWEWKTPGDPPILPKAGHLLVTAGQNTSAARVTAVACDASYVGNGWIPVTGTTTAQAKAIAVFINSTVGQLLIMKNPGESLGFPSYSTAVVNALPIPDIADPRIVSPLADCWEATRHFKVPQFRDGYTEVRRTWDTAVCETLGWDSNEMADLGRLLAREPRVSGVAYGHWKA